MGGSVYSKDTKEPEFKKYRRSVIDEIRPYVLGEALADNVSISAVDRAAGSPNEGDMIARKPTDHAAQWLIAKEEFAANYEPIDAMPGEAPAFSG